LGFHQENSTTAYFGKNITKNDLKLIKNFMKSQKLSLLNTRAFKKANNHFIISIGSIEKNKK
jgi:hypothetical protein